MLYIVTKTRNKKPKFVNSLKKKGLQFRFKFIYNIDRSNDKTQIVNVPEYRGND